jgi:dihydroorotase
MAGIPAQAEEIILQRDLALVRLTGARYHAQHLSTASGVELVAAAKADGLPVSAEVTPHHLALTDAHVAGTDAAYRVRPPLRAEIDREALRSGLRLGIIDAVATDHAPHAAHDKDVPFEEAPPGMIGLETAAALVNEYASLGPWEFFERMATAPARIAQLDALGRPVAAGAPANLVVFDPKTRWVPSEFVSRSSNSPFVGMPLVGEVRYTVYAGRMTYRDGKVQR